MYKHLSIYVIVHRQMGNEVHSAPKHIVSHLLTFN